MDKFIKDVRKLREQAEKLAESGNFVDAPSCIEEGKNCLKCGGENWLQNLRQKAGVWKGKPLVVLSLFDGIGGVWVALESLGIPVIGYSCEVNAEAIRVTQRNYPTVRHLGDIHQLKRGNIKEKIDLVIGGFPCQDLTCLGVKLGLHGHRSRLFFQMLRIIKVFSPTWFLAENVASMTWVDREEISKYLNTTPIEIDSQNFTPCKRRRLYWSNLPYPKTSPLIRESEGTSIQSVVEDAAALARKNSCVLTSNNKTSGKVSMELVYDLRQDKVRFIDLVEVELMMGYPPHYTNVKFEDRKPNHPKGKWAKTRDFDTKTPGLDRSIRWRLLGNTFSVSVIAYLLSPLLEADVRAHTRVYHLPSSVREEDCSVMVQGEIWAMYNVQQRPNWYAQIETRSGERFDETGYEPGMKSSRQPLQIEVKFLELTKPYEAGERDSWSTIRGTGLYFVSEKAEVDVQKTWVTFSHRVTSMLRLDDGQFFIYPGGGEVWSVYDSGTGGRYLVYVLESSLNKQSVKKGIPGKEGFSARCRLLQKQREFDHFGILDRELVYTDLSAFCFRAPYHFINARDVLKIELSVKHRDRGAHSDKRTLKRGRSSRHSESDDDDFMEMDLEEDCEGEPTEIRETEEEPREIRETVEEPREIRETAEEPREIGENEKKPPIKDTKPLQLELQDTRTAVRRFTRSSLAR